MDNWHGVCFSTVVLGTVPGLVVVPSILSVPGMMMGGSDRSIGMVLVPCWFYLVRTVQ